MLTSCTHEPTTFYFYPTSIRNTSTPERLTFWRSNNSAIHYLRWTELFSSGWAHQCLPSPALDRTDWGGSFGGIALVIVAVIIIVIVAIVIVVAGRGLGSVPELFSHAFPARHPEGLPASAHRYRVVVLFFGILVGGIIVREASLDVWLFCKEWIFVHRRQS